jgi:MFS family permease
MDEKTVRRFAVLTAAAGLSTWAVDFAATQVALPTQQATLGISVTASQWILNLSLMILAGLVATGGALGDRAGRMRLFRVGMLLIIAGAAITFAGGLLNSFPVVLLGRAIEGVGAACFIPASTAVLLDVFPLAERGGAQGQMMMISMAVTAFAPTVVGLIVQAVAWPFAYLLTILFAGIALLLARRVRYDQQKPAAAPFDYLGSVLLFVSVSLLIMGIMRAGSQGFSASDVWLLIGAGLVLGVILVLVSLRKAQPLIQFRIMQIRNVAIAVFVSFMRFLPNILMGAMVARYAQQVLGLSPTVTGMLMILPTLAQVVAAPIAGKMLDRSGPRTPVSSGVGLLAVGLIVLAFGFPAQSIWLVLIGTILGGAGFAFTNPVQMAALSQVPVAQRGMLAGIFPLAGQFGTAFWVALLSAGLGIFMNTYLTNNQGATDAAAQASALSVLAWIGVALTLATLVVALLLKSVVAPGKAAASGEAAAPQAAARPAAAGK